MRPGDIYYDNNRYKIIISVNSEVINYYSLNIDFDSALPIAMIKSSTSPNSFTSKYIGCVEYNENEYIFIANAMKRIANNLKTRCNLPIKKGEVYYLGKSRYILITFFNNNNIKYYEVDITPGVITKIEEITTNIENFSATGVLIGKVEITYSFMYNVAEFFRIIDAFNDVE